MEHFPRTMIAAVLAAAALLSVTTTHAQKTLQNVMNSNLKILDPIWTIAFVVRNHGYMICDTLFVTDANGDVEPQMLDRYDVTADRLSCTTTLRDDLT